MLDSPEARLAALLLLVWLLICAGALALIGTAPRTGGRGDPRALNDAAGSNKKSD
jgi:hypothetical protein